MLLAASLMVVLALFLLGVNFNGRVNRLFALFLLFEASRSFFYALSVFTPDVDDSIYWGRISAYFVIGLPFLLLLFISHYPRPRGLLQLPAGLWLIVAIGVVVEALYLLDHGLYSQVDRAGVAACVYTMGSHCAVSLGPLWMMNAIGFLLVALGALSFAMQVAVETDASRRSSLYYTSIGFCLSALFMGTRHLLNSPGYFAAPAGLWDLLDSVVAMIGAGVTALALLALLRDAFYVAPGQLGRAALSVLALPIASALLLSTFSGSLWNNTPLTAAIVGFWRLSLPAYVSYAILRHQLFDIKIKIRWTVKQSTIAAVFVAVFFVVSEGAQQLFSTRVGPVLGVVSSGLLVFAFSPLQRFAERVSKAAVPDAKPIAETSTEERMAFYRESVEAAWADGRLEPSEVDLLRRLRRSLGLSADDAESIESLVMAKVSRRPSPVA